MHKSGVVRNPSQNALTVDVTLVEAECACTYTSSAQPGIYEPKGDIDGFYKKKKLHAESLDTENCIAHLNLHLSSRHRKGL